MAADPLFADSGADDYHLKSEYGRYVPSTETFTNDAVSGPCLDMGDPTMRVVNEQQPAGNRVNMGAYGNTLEASKSKWNIVRRRRLEL